MKMEYRQLGEIRKSSEEGIVEGYLTAWGTVDSYKTSFQRGCFKRTFEERGHKIKLLWNHETLAGKVLECREDDYGPFVSVQFNLDTQIGREAFAHVREGDVDAFSFGFNVIADDWANNVRTFTEIKVMECGPVVFPANEAAKVTDSRAEDFDETFNKNEISSRGWKLMDALYQTIDDIFWGEERDPNTVKGMVDEAISKFHGHYMKWLDEWYQQFRSEDIQKLLTRSGNAIQEAIKSAELETITRETSLTDSDIDRLKIGKLLSIENRAKLLELPENIRTAHQAERRNTVEALCSEIRESGFNEAEKQRFRALLGVEIEQPSGISEALSFIDNLRNSIRK